MNTDLEIIIKEYCSSVFSVISEKYNIPTHELESLFVSGEEVKEVVEKKKKKTTSDDSFHSCVYVFERSGKNNKKGDVCSTKIKGEGYYCSKHKNKKQTIESNEKEEKKEEKKGKVFIASMNLRGKWAEKPVGTTCINVTSAQAKASKNRLDFSPMTAIEGGYRRFYNFESFWQSGKVFEHVKEEKTKDFWLNCKEAKRRFPGSKGKKVLHSRFLHLPSEKMDYITSRKRVYVPEYFELMKDKEMACFWKDQVEAGENVVIYDFDGPRLEDGDVTCLEVTQKMLQEKIKDPRFPFGHGYVVAAWLASLSPDKYI